jgi:hypothetical protein
LQEWGYAVWNAASASPSPSASSTRSNRTCTRPCTIAGERGVSTRTVAPRRASLIEKDMIYSPAYVMTAFTVPLFDEFLARRAEGSQD